MPSTQCLLKILHFLFQFAVAKETNKEFVEIIKMSPASVVIIFICFFSIWSVIGLAGFHTYLTTSDQTTNEDVSIYLVWHRQCINASRFQFQ